MAVAKKKPGPLEVRITRLEMTLPPKVSLPVPVNIQTALMRAPAIPLAFYRFLYWQVGARWHWVDRLRLTDAQLSAALHDERNSVTVLYVNGAPAGFFEFYQQDTDTVELTHFGLMEHALGLGIGKWFLLQALYAAWTPSPQKIVTTTNTLDHPRALQLYQRFGFSPVSTSDAMVTPLAEKEILTVLR